VGPPRRFPVRFTGLNRALAALGMSRRNSAVAVDDAAVVCVAGWGGWAFRGWAPRASVVAVGPDDGRVLGWGVHGWRGRWLVNGSSSGIVRIELDPPARGRVVGVPVRVRELRVAVEDPDGLVAALRGPAAAAGPDGSR
jgi:hypothetical protein